MSDGLNPSVPVGAEEAPDDIDTFPTEEDGEQDVDQELQYEETEADSDDEDDPEVHEAY